MKTRYTLIMLLMVWLCHYSTAQILCINCYDQNDSISQNVNNLLLNGGFEKTTCVPNSASSCFCPNSLSYSCDILNWTCTGGGMSTYAHIYDTTGTASIVVQGANAVYFGNYLAFPCSSALNDTSCLIKNLCTTQSPPPGYPKSFLTFGDTSGISIQQTVPALTIGETYVLEFWTGGEDIGVHPYYDGLFAVDLGFGKTFLRDPTTPQTTGIGRTYVIQFNATSSSHTIKFTNWGHICDSCTELVLDNVRLYTLAELDASVPHCYTGINKINDDDSVNVFPNPFSDKLNITTSKNELSEIIIYDITSRKIMLQKFTGSASLNTEPLTKGIYIYEVRNNNGVIKKGKIVKE
jgi:hypothetical protein